MDFENELIPGVLVKRYKRFFADIKLKDKTITALVEVGMEEIF